MMEVVWYHFASTVYLIFSALCTRMQASNKMYKMHEMKKMKASSLTLLSVFAVVSQNNKVIVTQYSVLHLVH